MIEFDVETTGLQWYHDEMFLAQFLANAGPYAIKSPKTGTDGIIQQGLDRAREDGGIRAWNSKFDFHFADSAGYKLPPEHTWHDGKIVAALMDERKSTALKARAELLGVPNAREPEQQVKAWLMAERKRRKKAAKDEGAEYVPPDYSDVPMEIMEPYALEDCVLTRAVGDIYDPVLKTNDELRDLYELERETMVALYHVEKRGVPVDREAALKLEASLLADHDRLEAEAIALAGIDTFNPRSPMQVSEALDRRGADVSHATRDRDTKILKTDAENLEAIDDALAAKILEYRGTAKMYKMVFNLLHEHTKKDIIYGPEMTGEDKLHPFYWQQGARTGRMSATDPNIQQWHRDDLRMRYMVQAPPGYKLISCDLDAIEMRIFAAYAGPGPMLDAIKADRDMHTMAAMAVQLGERRRSTGAVESVRQRGKVWNYLTLYGGGVRTIRKNFGVSTARAKEMQAQYLQAFPEVAALQARISYALYERGHIKTLWGRRQRVERSAEKESYKFTNYLVQGTAADLLKAGLAEAHRQGIQVIAAVHDELVALAPVEDADDVARALVSAMTEAPGMERLSNVVPLVADAAIVDRWSDAKTPGYVPGYMEA